MAVGADQTGVIVVAKVVSLIPSETVRLDSDKLDSLYSQLGLSNAEEVVCRALEELAVRLASCERLWGKRDWVGLRKSARSLIAIADQVGMCALARVARNVTLAVDAEDPVAVRATLCRLARVGEGSLSAAWDVRDISV